jgi:NAD(P)-dependent dehydrogenase (short-subunit alcohol dehydrogenase family)
MENQKNSSLAGKRVVILGGSSGIGLATVQAVAAEGGDVVIVSSNPQRINQALQTLPATAQGHSIDLSQEENIKNFFDTLGKFDHLVYTAGENLALSTIDATNLADAQQFFVVRFWGAFATVKYAAPNINAGGSITMTGGTAGARPGKGWTVASSICGAMEGLVRALAVELAPIRVNSVVPGLVKTNLWGSMNEHDRELLFKQMAENYLVKRVGEAQDIALAHLYLMQQQFGTGQNLVIDGGGLLV